MSETIFRSITFLIEEIRRMELMAGTMEALLVNYILEGIDMTQTLEEFRESMRQRGRELMIPTPEDIVKAFSAEEIFRVFSVEERLRGLPAEEILKGLSPEEIKAYLKTLTKKTKATPQKKPETADQASA